MNPMHEQYQNAVAAVDGLRDTIDGHLETVLDDPDQAGAPLSAEQIESLETSIRLLQDLLPGAATAPTVSDRDRLIERVEHWSGQMAHIADAARAWRTSSMPGAAALRLDKSLRTAGGEIAAIGVDIADHVEQHGAAILARRNRA